MVERYYRYTHNLCPLWAVDRVAIQSPLNCQWNITGKIIMLVPDHQYRIRVNGSGRLTLKCRFLRKNKIKAAPNPIVCTTSVRITSTTNALLLYPNPAISSGNDTCTAIEPKTRLLSSKIPWTLPRVFPHNRPGLKERHSPHTTLPAQG